MILDFASYFLFHFEVRLHENISSLFWARISGHEFLVLIIHHYNCTRYRTFDSTSRDSLPGSEAMSSILLREYIYSRVITQRFSENVALRISQRFCYECFSFFLFAVSLLTKIYNGFNGANKRANEAVKHLQKSPCLYLRIQPWSQYYTGIWSLHNSSYTCMAFNLLEVIFDTTNNICMCCNHSKSLVNPPYSPLRLFPGPFLNQNIQSNGVSPSSKMLPFTGTL